MTSPERIPIERFGTLDSTQAEGRRRVEKGHVRETGELLLAREQTDGTGTRGRSWHSPPGGVWATFVLPVVAEEQIDGLGIRLGLAACETIIDHAESGGDVRLKWPNDILLDNRKVAGCLAEVLHGPKGRAALLGVGINANNPMGLVDGLRRLSISLVEATGSEADLEAIAERLATELAWVGRTRGLNTATLARADDALWGIGERWTAETGQGGTLIGVGSHGGLVLDMDDGTHWRVPVNVRVTPGEVREPD
ncbi:MAG: biotin--[acetyl-CoA-carboxylase] ligase [Planctomycetota bacterium]